MNQTDRGDVPANEVDGLGLNCSVQGLSLAGVPLLHMTPLGFAPRPNVELTELMKCAYGRHVDLTSFSSSLEVIAKALNCGDLGRAMIAATQMRLPKLSWMNAARMANSDEMLTKFNVEELRDWLGRWTTGGATKPGGSIRAKPARDHRASGPGLRLPNGQGIAPAIAAAAVSARVAALAPMQVAEAAAVGEEVAGGGPVDPFADIAALGTLGVGACWRPDASLAPEERRVGGGVRAVRYLWDRTTMNARSN